MQNIMKCPVHDLKDKSSSVTLHIHTSNNVTENLIQILITPVVWCECDSLEHG
jgi:hypothetical protein